MWYGHGSNLTSINLNLSLLFCPTSKVEFLNLIISFGVDNIIPKPPSSEKHLPDSAPPLH
jgi:hypothetical protein